MNTYVSNYKLNWEAFDWKEFQRLCILIAEYKFPGCDFQEYLRQGHKQDGTDLQSFDYKDGQLLNIQCKKVKKLSETDLKKIVDEFANNELVTKSSHFVLATNVDTNTPRLTKAITKLKEDFFFNHAIEFHCWGRLEVEKYLKDNPGIVMYFFGKEAAESFCYPQLIDYSFGKIETIPNFISRKIFRSHEKNAEKLWWHFDSRYFEDLTEIIAANRITSKDLSCWRCLPG